MAEASESDRYELDEDGYLRETVGSWVHDKHVRLVKYIAISRSVRAKFIGKGKAGATFIELYSGPGRIRVRDESQAINGSPLIAWHEAVGSDAPFTEIHVADENVKLLNAVEARLRAAGAPVFAERGPAAETVDRVISRLNPYALHFAFLDPYNLGDLNFEIIKKLASLKRMDILIHVSTQDLQRNLQRYIDRKKSPLDRFAPGWREHVDISRPHRLIRAKILEYWRGLLKAEGMATTEMAEVVSGPQNQPLYLLAFAARHKLALDFWDKVRNMDGNQEQLLL